MLLVFRRWIMSWTIPSSVTARVPAPCEEKRPPPSSESQPEVIHSPALIYTINKTETHHLLIYIYVSLTAAARLRFFSWVNCCLEPRTNRFLVTGTRTNGCSETSARTNQGLATVARTNCCLVTDTKTNHCLATSTRTTCCLETGTRTNHFLVSGTRTNRCLATVARTNCCQQIATSHYSLSSSSSHGVWQ